MFLSLLLDHPVSDCELPHREFEFFDVKQTHPELLHDMLPNFGFEHRLQLLDRIPIIRFELNLLERIQHVGEYLGVFLMSLLVLSPWHLN